MGNKVLEFFRSNGKYFIIVLILLAGCSVDRHTKKWAAANLKGRPPVTMVKGFVELGFSENRGMVFGLFNQPEAGPFMTVLGYARVLILIGFSALIFIRRRRTLGYLLPFVLIMAGAWGNVFDGLRHGYVIDFIHLQLGTVLDWPFLFNAADVYLCVGMALLLVKEFFIRRDHKTTAPCP